MLMKSDSSKFSITLNIQKIELAQISNSKHVCGCKTAKNCLQHPLEDGNSHPSLIFKANRPNLEKEKLLTNTIIDGNTFRIFTKKAKRQKRHKKRGKSNPITYNKIKNVYNGGL